MCFSLAKRGDILLKTTAYSLQMAIINTGYFRQYFKVDKWKVVPGKLIHTLGVYLAKQTLIVVPGERHWTVK